MFDTVIHGFSIVLIGSIWDSLTAYLIHRKKAMDNDRDKHDEAQLEEITTDSKQRLLSERNNSIRRIESHEMTNISHHDKNDEKERASVVDSGSTSL